MTNNNTEFPDYKAILSGDDGAYRFHIAELGIVAIGPDVAAAHRELEEKKRKVFDEFASAGIAGELPPAGAAKASAETARHRRFAIRTTIVTTAALVVIVAATFGARSVITTGIDAVKIKPGEIHLKLLEDKLIQTLHAAADPRNDFSAEKRQQVIEDLRAIVERYKPFADEIRPLISGGGDARPSQPAQQN